MGHIRLGRLPRNSKWKDVVQSLANNSSSLPKIVQLTSRASQKVLSATQNTEGLTKCYWLFTNIAQASRKGDFAENLNKLGISISSTDSGIKILKQIFYTASNNLKSCGNVSVLDQIAIDSFKNAIHSTISDEATNLFGCHIDSIQKAFKKYSTPAQVAYLGRQYFSQYMYNSFSFALEKELSNSISSEGRFQNSADIQKFNDKLKTYCWEVSKIVESCNKVFKDN